ncbi:hypothetical protein G6O67_000609 [Ophiocordyceps sinensis]|uniref:Uncharacterized protein n=1 Tax=Ophiocordyceps sinensis TaxID=72228 RepID=A0A8H4PZJ5_9HYPO|nr:hypothetical protein G6O67_000609 [Ophiocordyceps sinensis]
MYGNVCVGPVVSYPADKVLNRDLTRTHVLEGAAAVSMWRDAFWSQGPGHLLCDGDGGHPVCVGSATEGIDGVTRADPVLKLGPVPGVVDAPGAVAESQVVQRPGGGIEASVVAAEVSARVERVAQFRLSVEDARVAGSLTVTVAALGDAASAGPKGHEVAEADAAQVRERIAVALGVDTVGAHLEAAVAGRGGGAGHGAAVVVVDGAVCAVLAPGRAAPELGPAAVERVRDAPRRRQVGLGRVSDDVAAVPARQLAGLAARARLPPRLAVAEPAAARLALLGHLVVARVAGVPEPSQVSLAQVGPLLHQLLAHAALRLEALAARVAERRVHVASAALADAHAVVAGRRLIVVAVLGGVSSPHVLPPRYLALVRRLGIRVPVVGAVAALDYVLAHHVPVARPRCRHELPLRVRCAKVARLGLDLDAPLVRGPFLLDLFLPGLPGLLGRWLLLLLLLFSLLFALAILVLVLGLDIGVVVLVAAPFPSLVLGRPALPLRCRRRRPGLAAGLRLRRGFLSTLWLGRISLLGIWRSVVIGPALALRRCRRRLVLLCISRHATVFPKTLSLGSRGGGCSRLRRGALVGRLLLGLDMRPQYTGGAGLGLGGYRVGASSRAASKARAGCRPLGMPGPARGAGVRRSCSRGH